MTTTLCTTAEGAPDDSADALDPFKGLSRLLPKLTRPSWVRLIGTTHVRVKLVKPSAAAVKAIRRNERRLSRALAGEFTRVRHATA